MHICQPEVATLQFVSQASVIDAQAVQDGRIEVVDRDRIAHDVVAEIIRLADGHATFDAASRQPKSEAARMMIAAIVVRSELALRVDSTPEFPAPDDESVLEHTALLEVLN